LPARAGGPGRRRQFCKDSCRQLDYQARRRAAEVGLGDDQVVVSRGELDELHDKLYVLETAMTDVERDLAGARTVADHREALTYLLDAARPLTGRLPFT
jgi:hypothetical protein